MTPKATVRLIDNSHPPGKAFVPHVYRIAVSLCQRLRTKKLRVRSSRGAGTETEPTL